MAENEKDLSLHGKPNVFTLSAAALGLASAALSTWFLVSEIGESPRIPALAAMTGGAGAIAYGVGTRDRQFGGDRNITIIIGGIAFAIGAIGFTAEVVDSLVSDVGEINSVLPEVPDTVNATVPITPINECELNLLEGGGIAPDDTGSFTKLQAALRDAGFDPGPIDGNYGEMSAAAMSAFKDSHGIPQERLIDDQTCSLFPNLVDGDPNTPIITFNN